MEAVGRFDDWKSVIRSVPEHPRGRQRGGLWQQYTFQIRVPVDDENTRHYCITRTCRPKGRSCRSICSTTCALRAADRRGRRQLLARVHPRQDMAWTTQGKIADRSRENLAARIAASRSTGRSRARDGRRRSGGDRSASFVTPRRTSTSSCRSNGIRTCSVTLESLFRRHMSIFSPIAEEIIAVFAQAREARREPPALRSVTPEENELLTPSDRARAWAR